jgi:hypothetical protein
MIMNLYDTKQKCLVRMEHQEAPIEMLVPSIRLKLLDMIDAKSKKLEGYKAFEEELLMIEDEIIRRCNNGRFAMPKFCE